MSQTDSQPTRTPPTEPGDYRQSLIDLRDGLERETKRLDELIAKLEPFAPTLPVMELWEGPGCHAIIAGPKAFVFKGDNMMATYYKHDLPKAYPHLRRTHICKWEPTDE